jgi:transketolase
MLSPKKSNLQVYEKGLSPSGIRRNIIELANHGNSGHIGCSFSIVEILTVLYSEVLKINWDDLDDFNRDILALSKGHGVMALYACFKEFGWVSQKQCENYLGPENNLKGLSSAHVPGIEISGGSLGQGITTAVGMAKAAKVLGDGSRVYCIIGDGEANEGSVWESLMFASHHQLDNFFLIVDNNGFQAMGETKNIIGCNSLSEKFRSFGLEALSVDGHDLKKLTNSFRVLEENGQGKPKALIANTVKGKGVSFMEHNNEWHYKRMSDEQFNQAMKELSHA